MEKNPLTQVITIYIDPTTGDYSAEFEHVTKSYLIQALRDLLNKTESGELEEAPEMHSYEREM